MHLHALEQRHEARQHHSHEENTDGNADAQDEDWIDHGRLELGLHHGKPLEMVPHAAEDINQRAARFAGLDHVDVEIGKYDRLFAHGFGKALAFHHVLLELAADFGGNALGFKVGHAVERHGQGHAGLDQVGQLIGEGGQLLELGLALLVEVPPEGRRQHGLPRFYSHGRPVGSGGSRNRGRAFRHFDHNREQAEPLNLRQRGRAVGDLQHARHHLARAAPGLVRKLSHRTTSGLGRLSLILTHRRGKVASESLTGRSLKLLLQRRRLGFGVPPSGGPSLGPQGTA